MNHKNSSPLLNEFIKHERRERMSFEENKDEDIFDFKVITPKGVQNASELLPGDKIYEFNGSDLLTVMKVDKIGPGNLCQVLYNDGRIARYVDKDNLYVGRSYMVTDNSNSYPPIANVGTLADIKETWRQYWKTEKASIYQYTTDFSASGTLPKISPEPDPYIAGALIAYGDFKDDYINLPINMQKAETYISDKYGIEYCQLGDDKVYFGRDYGDITKRKRIRWDEFFPMKDPLKEKDKIGNDLFNFYHYHRNGGKPHIPDVYKYASINDRWQFIRGVFDIGYTKDVFSNSVGIIHKSELMLKEIRNVLYSLGVISVITYNQMLQLYRGCEYMLTVLGSHKSNPHFFYGEESIEYLLAQQATLHANQEPDFSLAINKIFRRANVGYSYQIVVEEKGPLLYTTANYLPRVAV